jgi:hypothetical protein
MYLLILCGFSAALVLLDSFFDVDIAKDQEYGLILYVVLAVEEDQCHYSRRKQKVRLLFS